MLFALLLSTSAFSQDERFFRKIFTDELSLGIAQTQPPKIEVSTPEYLVDITRDGQMERIIALKRDGLDYIQIKDHFGRIKFDRKLAAKGVDSKLYKIQLKTISAKVDVLLLHYYEGAVGDIPFDATARVYFLAIENRNLDKLYLKKGPAFFMEKARPGNQYSRRKYSVNVIDYNKDGHNEVSVTYNGIHRIFFYKTKGLWTKM